LVLLVLLVEAPDALLVEDAELDVDADAAAADELDDEPVVGVAPVVAAAAAVDGGAELSELEWLLDPHAATSSAVISAAPMRLTVIDSA
jgi:hypothetical protein